MKESTRETDYICKDCGGIMTHGLVRPAGHRLYDVKRCECSRCGKITDEPVNHKEAV